MSDVLFTNVKIFDGTGAPSFRGEVLVSGNRIAAVAKGRNWVEARGAELVDSGGATLMPGLIDAHTHLSFASTVDRIVDFGAQLPSEQLMLATVRAGRTMLDHGFTSAYSAGCFNAVAEVALREEFARGALPGPRLRACSFEREGEVAGSGGVDYHAGTGKRRPDPEGNAAFVHAMAKLGVDSVKFVLSGESGLQPGTSRIVQFYDEELAAASQAAQQAGLWLSAHCHAAEAIKMAARNGFRVLYHCTWADEEAMDLLEARKQEIFIAPAPGINWANIHEGEAFGITREVAKQQEQFLALELVSELMPQLKKRGVRILPGGDYGFPWNPIGKNARDIELFVKLFGYTPAEALSAATKLGGEIMGMENELGLIRKGYLADLLLVAGDPLRDVSILQDRANLLAIMKDGQFHKRPATAPTRVDRAPGSGKLGDRMLGARAVHP